MPRKKKPVRAPTHREALGLPAPKFEGAKQVEKSKPKRSGRRKK